MCSNSNKKQKNLEAFVALSSLDLRSEDNWQLCLSAIYSCQNHKVKMKLLIQSFFLLPLIQTREASRTFTGNPIFLVCKSALAKCKSYICLFMSSLNIDV